eukprot:1137788-Pelagomonas_calceolata.AAC.3
MFGPATLNQAPAGRPSCSPYSASYQPPFLLALFRSCFPFLPSCTETHSHTYIHKYTNTQHTQTHTCTAVRDRSEALVRHLADSLALLPIIEHHCTAPRSTPQQTTTNIAASMSTSATTTTTTASARDKSSNTSERTQQKSSGPHSLRASQPDALADTEARGVNGAGMQSTPMAQPLRVIDVGTGGMSWRSAATKKEVSRFYGLAAWLVIRLQLFCGCAGIPCCCLETVFQALLCLKDGIG